MSMRESIICTCTLEEYDPRCQIHSHASEKHVDKDRIIALLTGKVDKTTQELVASMLSDGQRLAVIRDAFLQGRDIEAVDMIRELGDAKGLRKMLPISAYGVVAPHTTILVVSRPQISPFNAYRLLISRKHAEFYMVNDLRVGNRSQIVQSGNIPGDLFESDIPDMELGPPDERGFHTLSINQTVDSRMGITLDLEPCQAGMDLTLHISNIDDRPHPFHALMLGTCPYY